MKILYLTHTCPYPPNRGDRIRCYHILSYLSQNHEVILVYPVFDTEHFSCQKHLRRLCKSVVPIKYSSFVSRLSCLLTIFSSHSLSVSFYYSRTLEDVIHKLTSDLILVDCSTMASYALNISCPKILDFVDVDSQKWQYFSSVARFPRSLLYRTEAKRLSRYEKFLSQHYDYCLVTSHFEKSLLNDISHVAVLPNGVDQKYFSKENIPTGNSIIFTGVMNYFPNTDAVMHFHQYIFPFIKRNVPSAQFIIAGMHPTPQIRRLADRHTTVTGFVPDIRDYLSKAAVCVVPLRIAMGVQNKILEAMAMGVPVVATSVANRGINATPGQEILLADDPENFAAATTKLLNDRSLRETITNNAKQFIDQNFRWEKNLQKLDELIAKITSFSAIRRDISSS
jgi:sugar transferase (PEP-CTERM/EpsH1 system associated)